MTSTHEIINAHPTLLRVSGMVALSKARMVNQEGRQFPFLESSPDGSDPDREPSHALIESFHRANKWLTANAKVPQSFQRGDRHEQ